MNRELTLEEEMKEESEKQFNRKRLKDVNNVLDRLIAGIDR